MTNAELIAKIKAEIERRIKELNKDKYISADAQVCRTSELNYLLRFLSTLESEKPVPNDLEEAADNHIRKVADAAGHPGWDWETQDIADAFIAGANWQKQHDAELIEIAYNDGITIGMTKQKEQMMDEWLKDRGGCFWDGVEEGKKAMEDAILAIIESRLSEIIGDAQPKPALRAELQELINKIDNNAQ